MVKRIVTWANGGMLSAKVTTGPKATLAAIKGGWLEPIGDKYKAEGVTFSPATVGAGIPASLKVTIPSACTNGKTSSDGSSYGEYSVTLTVTTSTGTYTIGSKNRHRIVA